ncbi:pilin [Patescibacteria group bacterium]|nr:pilin [Patescibacteria group bacterium]
MEKQLLAQINLGQLGGEDGFGPWGWLGGAEDIGTAAGIFTQIISNIIGIMTVVAGIWFFFMLIIGAYGYLTAGGDSKKIEEATKKITGALTGLIVIVLAYALVSLIGSLLGIDILNPQDVIELLGP